jgi:membrane-bound ClpP family serine protease
MTVTGALILLAVGLLLIFLTVGVVHVIGIVCAAVAVIGLLMVLVAGPRSRV